MPESCSNCGQALTQNARFCRHCGAQQSPETEKTSAQTQQYGHSGPRLYSAPETPSPSFTYEPQAHDTSRVEHARNAVYSVPQPTGSSTKFWFFITALCILLIAGVASSAFFAARGSRGRNRAEWRDQARIEEQMKRHESEIERQAEQIARDVERAAEQAARDAERAGRDAERAARDAARAASEAVVVGRPLPPPLPPKPGGPPNASNVPNAPPPAGPIQIDDLTYPGATIDKKSAASGTIIASMNTGDSVRKVQDFYEKRLGKAIASGKEIGASFIQARNGTQTIVKITPPQGSDGRVQIVVVRTAVGGSK